MKRIERKWNFPILRNSVSYFFYIIRLNPLGFISGILDLFFLGASLILYFNDFGNTSIILLGIASIALLWDIIQVGISRRESRRIRLSEIRISEFPFDEIVIKSTLEFGE